MAKGFIWRPYCFSYFRGGGHVVTLLMLNAKWFAILTAAARSIVRVPQTALHGLSLSFLNLTSSYDQLKS